MVVIPFAISGFVLSHSFLASIHKPAEALSRLGFLTLRRWLRLFVPASISMFIACIFASFGAFDRGREFLTGPWFSGLLEQYPPRLETIPEFLYDFCDMWFK